jgi:hypothetical protein
LQRVSEPLLQTGRWRNSSPWAEGCFTDSFGLAAIFGRMAFGRRRRRDFSPTEMNVDELMIMVNEERVWLQCIEIFMEYKPMNKSFQRVGKELS